MPDDVNMKQDRDDDRLWRRVDPQRRREPLMTAEANLLGWVRCPGCGVLFKLSDRRRWTGYRHSTCGQRLQVTNVEQQAEPIWCLVGNITAERPDGPGGEETRSGTKHFAPGAKIYCFPYQWGDGYEKIRVLGYHRASRRLVKMVIRSGWLVNCRAELVYRPALLDELSGFWDGSQRARELAEELAALVNGRNARGDGDTNSASRVKPAAHPDE